MEATHEKAHKINDIFNDRGSKTEGREGGGEMAEAVHVCEFEIGETENEIYRINALKDLFLLQNYIVLEHVN